MAVEIASGAVVVLGGPDEGEHFGTHIGFHYERALNAIDVVWRHSSTPYETFV